jgi:integrase/recombinase XerD
MAKTPTQLQTHARSFIEAMRLRGYSPASLRSYGDLLGVFLAWLTRAGIEDVREVDSATVRDYRLWLGQQHYSPWTILARLQAVRRFFDHLETTEAVLMNPCVGQPALKVPRRLPKAVLTVAEARRLLEVPDPYTPKGLRDRAMLEVFYSCGIRLQEMTRLAVADVDSRNGFLRVNHGKFAQDRVVPLGQGASDWLSRYLGQVRSVWSPTPSPQQALWLSSVPPHQPIKSQAIQVMVRHYGQLAGLGQPLTPHVWRHTCASHLVAGGANIAYVQRLLGHASLRTTQIYVQTTVPEVKAMHAQAHPRNQDVVL